MFTSKYAFPFKLKSFLFQWRYRQSSEGIEETLDGEERGCRQPKRVYKGNQFRPCKVIVGTGKEAFKDSDGGEGLDKLLSMVTFIPPEGRST